MTSPSKNDNPLLNLLTAGAGGIEAQEAAGQAELVNSTVVPTRMDEDRETYEALGFVFGDQVEDDEIFTHVTLPEGWSKQATDHSMWSKIVDERGLERVSVFYKAAFYDRSAFMRLNDVGQSWAYQYIHYGDNDEQGYLLTRAECAQAGMSAYRYIKDSEADWMNDLERAEYYPVDCMDRAREILG